MEWAHKLEQISWIPDWMHLPLELFIVVLGVALAGGLIIAGFGLGVSLFLGSGKLVKNFWRWCFFAPVKLLDSFWPLLDGRWNAFLEKLHSKRVLRQEQAKLLAAKTNTLETRTPVAFLLDPIYLEQWKGIYLHRRKGGQTFQTWFSEQMESLAMTSVLTLDQVLEDMPIEETRRKR